MKIGAAVGCFTHPHYEPPYEEAVETIGRMGFDGLELIAYTGGDLSDYYMDSNIRYRLRMCIWKHWKTPQNRAKNLMKLDVPRWAAFKIAYCGDRYARLAHNGWVHLAISNKRLAEFGLISMLDYYTARCVTC